MQTKEFCAYNETRENFLSARVTVIDTKAEPLKMVKVLIEGLGPNPESGLWLNPLKSLPTVPRLSPYDLVYLDQDCRVMHGAALAPDEELPLFSGQVASALLLPIHTYSRSEAVPGDQVMICPAEEMESRPPRVAQRANPAPATQIVCITAKPSDIVPVPPPLLNASPIQHQPAIETFQVNDKAEFPGAQRESSGFRFLRGIARLRIHISVSIEPAPIAKSANTATGKPSANMDAPRDFRETRGAASVNQFLNRYARPAIVAISASVAQSSRSAARLCGSWKGRYVRWADQFMFRPANATILRTLRARFVALDKEFGQRWLKTRFLR
ncbi:MAG: hypothetical protein ACLPH3_11430 [Terracidiphilus sp.]